MILGKRQLQVVLKVRRFYLQYKQSKPHSLKVNLVKQSIPSNTVDLQLESWHYFPRSTVILFSLPEFLLADILLVQEYQIFSLSLLQLQYLEADFELQIFLQATDEHLLPDYKNKQVIKYFSYRTLPITFYISTLQRVISTVH